MILQELQDIIFANAYPRSDDLKILSRSFRISNEQKTQRTKFWTTSFP